MKAVVYQGFGSPDILHLQEIDKPVPGDGEVLIKVRAAAVNPLDWKLMKGGPPLARQANRKSNVPASTSRALSKPSA